jgi:hypothetical protein
MYAGGGVEASFYFAYEILMGCMLLVLCDGSLELYALWEDMVILSRRLSLLKSVSLIIHRPLTPLI